MTQDAEDDVVRRLLGETTTWSVVGLRDNPIRPAYGVARFLQQHGKRIVPVHHQPQDVYGETAYARLADIPFPVDVVDVFVNSTLAGQVADEAAAIGAAFNTADFRAALATFRAGRAGTEAAS